MVEKTGVTLGMGMTEKQGGTDVRANITRAERDGDGMSHHRPQMVHVGADVRRVPGAGAGRRRAYLFLHAALSARRQRVNALHFQRLKDKLGNRSNASSEVEFHGAYAERVGEEGAGIRTIIEMVKLTRLDCAIASAGLMRIGARQALHHARHRSVFQKQLADQPAMRAVLADMALMSRPRSRWCCGSAARSTAADDPRRRPTCGC